jgi:phosphatidylinositol alpha 1,6-mannosyltransferase
VSIPRVAFFTDSFHEVNGVALTSREFARFAREREYPFFSMHPGPETRTWREGVFETFEIRRGALSFGLENDLAFDLMFFRHRDRLARALADFQPDLLHITGPGHPGMLGAILAYRLGVPLVASWHTNVHEFGARRLQKLLHRFPAKLRRGAAAFAERKSLDLTMRFYKLARMLFAPNPELVAMLEQRTGRPAHLMRRGIDTTLFSPVRRDRVDREFVVGYVGRLSAEKNVRMLADLEDALIAAGVREYRFLVVGDGGERSWLAGHLKRAELPGILRGEPLARAYANMDGFVFPSETDTFGNVVLEAMSSGLVPIVSRSGGPKYLVRDGETGYLAVGLAEFLGAVLELRAKPELRRRMAEAARAAASAHSWQVVFDDVYRQYGEAFASGVLARSTRRVPASHHLMSTVS